MLTNILTPEIVTAIVGVIAMILIGQFPQFADQINQISAAIVAIIIALISAMTLNRISVRQEATKVQIAQLQINELRTYQAIKEEIRKPTV